MLIRTGAPAMAEFIERMHTVVERGEFTVTMATGWAVIGTKQRPIIVLTIEDLSIAMTRADAAWFAHEVAVKAKAELAADWERAGLYAGIASSLVDVLKESEDEDATEKGGRPTVH